MVEFLGCYFGCVLAFITIETIKSVKKPKEQEPMREAPKNISSISDPMSLYEKYTEKGLYKPIKNKVVNRIEVGTDEDSK
jgi:hypothetical protein